MNNKLTIRQIVFVFVFVTLTPIMNYVPNWAAYNAGGSGYVSILYTAILLLVFAALLLQIISAYPDMNFYEILQDICGIALAKLIIFLYGVWAFYYMTLKITDYSITLQTTLMPSIREIILVVFLFLLVSYAIMKGTKTVVRFAEFTIQPILFFLFLILLFAIPNIDKDNLIPITIVDLKNNFYSIADQCSIGGNLMILLFFVGQLANNCNKKQIKKRVYGGAALYSMIALGATIVTIGVNGAYITGKLSYPIFQTVKSISILNTFERLDPVITIVGVLSDFVCVCAFLVIMIQCFQWIFQKKHTKECCIVLFLIACSYVIINDDTQYEFVKYYRNRLVYINLIFQYVIPIVLGTVCMVKNLTTKKWRLNEFDEIEDQGSMDENGQEASEIEDPKL